MAARKTPASPKPDKLLRDALLLELNTDTLDENGKKVRKFRRIAANLVRSGLDNKLDAIREIWDRVEGRPTQSVGIGQAEDLEPLEQIVRPVVSREEWLKLHGK
ncbi:MAG TPA: hypothetical protein VG892_07620 [Terriglobales bacterium]|nr:hypothetical protein [Terriglobales bacterium]